MGYNPASRACCSEALTQPWARPYTPDAIHSPAAKEL
jgi:hypothetical protein